LLSRWQARFAAALSADRGRLVASNGRAHAHTVPRMSDGTKLNADALGPLGLVNMVDDLWAWATAVLSYTCGSEEEKGSYSGGECSGAADV